MKFSRISATSIFAMAATVWPAHACILIPVCCETTFYDLIIYDSEANVTAPCPAMIAVAVPQAAAVHRKDIGITWPVDQCVAVGISSPFFPLVAAPGMSPDDDHVAPFAGAWHWNAWQEALAIGVAMIAPLIGTFGNGSSPGENPGSTVSVARLTQTGSNDDSISESRRGLAAASVGAPRSTSTATINVAGPANLRQRAGSWLSATGPADAHSKSPASELVPADTARPTPLYHYTPQPNRAAWGDSAMASFSNAVMGSGDATLVYRPIGATSHQAGARPGQPNSLLTNQDAAMYGMRIDVILPIHEHANATGTDGTQDPLPASVNIDPAAMVARYITRLLDAAPPKPSVPLVEVFQVGPTNVAHTQGRLVAGMANPLREKIPAGVGPLNNSLALP